MGANRSLPHLPFPNRFLDIGCTFWRCYSVGRLGGVILEEFDVADPANRRALPERKLHMSWRDDLDLARIIRGYSDQRTTSISRDPISEQPTVSRD